MTRLHSRQRFGWMFVMVSLFWNGYLEAASGSLTLKIRAINPSKTEKQPIEIKRPLPKMVKPDDVIDAGGFDVVYDVASKGYFVQKTVEMEAAQTLTFDVVIKDIWVIPEQTLTELTSQASSLASLIEQSEQGKTGGKLATLIRDTVKEVADRQAAYAVGVAKPIDHIRTYESNIEALGRVRRDVGVLENLVIAAGKAPAQLLGAPQGTPPVEPEGGSTTGEVVTLHIKVTNPSPTDKRPVPLKRDLPAEVKPTDVIDAGGLQVGFDTARNLCYVYAESVELGPQETKVFDLKLRNPWSDTLARIPRLETRASELVRLTQDRPEYKVVQNQAQALLKQLDGVKGQKGPDVVNEQYVAHARRRGEEVRQIEAGIMRLEELFQPREKPTRWGVPMMDVPRPDRRTTWVIIYIVLGFLGLFSAAFFLRWYGRSKSEKLDRSAEPAEVRPSTPDKTPGAGGS